MPLGLSENRCPLCASASLRPVARIPGAHINDAYRRSFGIDAGVVEAAFDYLACSHCGLHFFAPPGDGDARLYEQLQRFEWYYASIKPEYAIAARHLPARGPVLEVGSGKAAFADLAGRARYLGLEFNDAAIARAGADGVTLLKEPIDVHARSRPGHYAAVVSFQVLEHVRAPAAFIAGCVEALAPGGTLILAVPDHEGLCGIAQNNILDMPPHHVSHWSSRTLAHVAVQFGLDTVAIEREPVAPVHIEWARRSLIEQRLRRWVGLRPSLLDTRLASRLVGRAAATIARWFPPDVDKVSGHTVVGCFRKP